MYWEEDEDSSAVQIPDDVVDLVFSISAKTLPIDHAYALSQAVAEQLPWFVDEPLTGLHTIHVAASSNGWYRPDSPDQVLYPSAVPFSPMHQKSQVYIPNRIWKKSSTLLMNSQVFLLRLLWYVLIRLS